VRRSKDARAACSALDSTAAIADGAVVANPVRGSSARLNSSAKKAPRALTVEDTGRLVELFHASSRAAELGLADLVDWMHATGARTGEALALRTGGTVGRRLLIWTPGPGRSAAP
jgi:integrase